MATVVRKQICKWVCERTGETADRADAVIRAFIEKIYKTLEEGDVVKFRGFGTFELKRRAPRVSRNVKTGEPVNVPARSVVVFKPSSTLKEAVYNVEPRGR